MDSYNIFEGLKENKKSLLIALIMIIILIIVSIFNLFLNNNEEELDVEGVITTFAQIYYEEHYYKSVTGGYGNDYIEKLKRDEQEGITLTLRDMIATFDELNTENFYQEGNYCNFTGTYATIYPTNPYGLKDYKIDVVVSCAEKFDNK